MTSDAESDVAVSNAVEDFIKATKILHLGYFLFNTEIEKKGLKMIKEAMTIIDTASPIGRDVLLPLLDHPNDAIQATAACGLWQSHPEVVVPMLEHMEKTSVTDAGVLAMQMLMTKGRFNPCGSNPRFPNLYGDETDPMRWANDDAWRLAIMRSPNKY